MFPKEIYNKSFPLMCLLYLFNCDPQVYLKELERQQLQDTLHKDVMRKIIFLQLWFRARLERRYFLEMRQAAILIQVSCVITLPLCVPP